MAESGKRRSSSDAVSRSITERRNSSKKRRKWIKGLAIVSSEDDSESANKESKVNANQMIALRFPYPMLSDNSDDEEDLKFFPNDCLNTRVNTQEKRKHISSSDEDTSYRHKKRKKKLDDENKNSSEEQNKEAKRDCQKNNHSKQNLTFSDKENFTYDSPRKHVKSKSSYRRISSTPSTSSDEDIHYKRNKSADTRKPKKGSKRTPSTNVSKNTSKSFNSANAKSSQSSQKKSDNFQSSTAVISNQTNVEEFKSEYDTMSIPQVSTEKNSRFLDSSSCESVKVQKSTACEKQKTLQTRSKRNVRFGRRIHILSTSSSDSDNDEAVNNQAQHNLANSRVTQSSTGYNKSNHSMSTSDDEDVTTIKNVNKNNEAKTDLPQATRNVEHPCYNLLKNFNNTEPQQSVENKNKNGTNKVSTVSKNSNKKKTNNSKAKVSNIKSSAWTNIGNAPIKSKSTSSEHLTKINDMKKKFISSNISSIELHKQIQNKSNVDKNNKQSSSGLNRLDNQVSSILSANVEVNSNNASTDFKINEQKSTIVQNSGDIRQPIENKYTVNVNVFCGSPQTSEIESTENGNEGRNFVNPTRPSDQTKLDINLSLHESESETNITNNTKKTRISHINKNEQGNKPITTSEKSLKIKNKKASKTSNKQNENEVEPQSKECDVLGGILSEMENNRYKLEKPIKRAMDPPNLLNWAPNPLLFSNKTLSYNHAINSKLGVQSAVQPDLVSSWKTNYVPYSSATTGVMYNPSRLDYTDGPNLPRRNSEEHKAYPVGCAEKDQSITMNFYSANSPEYRGTDGVNPTPLEQNGLENSLSCKVQTPNNINNAEKEEDKKVLKRLDSTSTKILESVKTDEANKINPKSEESTASGKGRFKPENPHEGDLTKQNITNIEKTTSTDKDNTKGVRIMVGGQCFRLPPVSLSVNNVPLTTNISNEEKVTQHHYVDSKIVDDPALTASPAPSTVVSDTASQSLSKDLNISHSKDSESSSDSEATDKSDSDSSDSDSSSSNSSDGFSRSTQEESRLSRGVKNIPTKKLYSTTKNKSLKNQTSSDSKLNSQSISQNVSKGAKHLERTSDSDSSSSNSSDGFSRSTQEESRLSRGVKNIPTKKLYSTTKNKSLKNQTSSDSKLNSQSISQNVSKGAKHLERTICNNNDIIVLSDSSDPESSNRNVESVDVKPKTIKREVPPNSIFDNSNKTDSVHCVGKIRVKSLRDLGVQDEMVEVPDNALSSAPAVLPPASEILPPAPEVLQPAPEVLQPTPVVLPPPPVALPSAPVVLPTASEALPPAPVVLPPAPVVSTPAPVVLPPAPMVSTPAPVVLPPAPVVSTPAPVVLPPAPVVSTPAPVVLPPAPVVSTPAPVVLPPAPRVSKPAPGVSTPAPGVLPPAPVVLPKLMSRGQPNSTSNITKTQLDRETLQIQPGQPGPTKVVLAVTHQMVMTNKTINSIISESHQRNNVNNSLSSNQSAALTEVGANTSKQQVVQDQQTQNQVNESFQAPSYKGTPEHVNDLFTSFFTEVVQLKIPKLVDDLHLAIIHDRLKDERLKRLDQLISPETIASERKRAEKDFNDLIKIRGQSFVPLFMTVVNKIDKDSFKFLMIAFYYMIVHQLERIDPGNAEYRFKLKDIIKCMLQKIQAPGSEQVSEVFNLEDSHFISNFNFVEKYILGYNGNPEENKRESLASGPETNTQSSSAAPKTVINSDQLKKVDTGGNNPTNASNAPSTHFPVRFIPVSAATTSVILAVIKEQETQQMTSNQNQPKPPGVSGNQFMPSTSSATSRPPISRIGNLDELILKKNSPAKNRTPR